MKPKYRRTTFFINPNFQGQFLACTLGMNLLTFAALFGAQKYYFRLFSQMNLGNMVHEGGLQQLSIHFQERAMTHIFMGTMLLVTCVSLIYGLYFSHRIAGPLYRLRQYLLGRSQGGSKEVLKFRKGDYFQELADATNKCFQPENK